MEINSPEFSERIYQGLKIAQQASDLKQKLSNFERNGSEEIQKKILANWKKYGYDS